MVHHSLATRKDLSSLETQQSHNPIFFKYDYGQVTPNDAVAKKNIISQTHGGQGPCRVLLGSFEGV